MSVGVITGSAGLIGSEAARYFAAKGMQIIGIDNNMREVFFGIDASTDWQRQRLARDLGKSYIHYSVDIRNTEEINKLFQHYGNDICLVIHTAAQPSHDWAARAPFTDFTINANGTLTILEATRQFASDAVLIFTSTNKVYGDTPNRLPLVEMETRWEIDETHPYYKGIPEEMSVDQTLHSLFGASKVAADVLVQEYGRYFNIKTACFRGGCLTGPNHSGTQLHGFLAYLMKCTVIGQPYTVFGYKGKQVRDNIHSNDLIRAFDAFYENPGSAKVYNMGGGRFSNCSVVEAIELCQKIAGRELSWKYSEANRSGDHMWWISDLTAFKTDHPAWELEYTVSGILREIFEFNHKRWLEMGH